jgi:hypothetical protein
MIRLSYRGHDIVIFISHKLRQTEVTIESLDMEIVLDRADLSAGVHKARTLIDDAIGTRTVTYLSRIA